MRATKAAANRRRMVAAALGRFSADGWAGTTMASIAEEAGVAVQTLYYTFHTKGALLEEAIGAAILGIDGWEEPPREPDTAELVNLHGWWAPFADATTATEALDLFVEAGVPILARVAPLLSAMRSTVGDAEAEAVVRVAEERRADSYREAVHVLAGKPHGLRGGLDEAAATDVLLALFSAEVYATLAARGWTADRCLDFFRDLLQERLLRD
ncbi:MAG: TetR/AcrR family transcriptional regulator [Actinomycetota bacterium]|nr:TetR/AcrR family transcriptional regulator [Actinomycetota bacterium]